MTIVIFVVGAILGAVVVAAGFIICAAASCDIEDDVQQSFGDESID